MLYKFSKKEIDNVVFNNFTFKIKVVHVLTLGWSKLKGDWWYDRDPSNAKFFRLQRKELKNHTRYAIFLGRLALTYMKGKE